MLFSLLLVLLAVAPVNAPAAEPSRPATSPSPVAVSHDQLLSHRALRAARLLIQMRVLQLRDERLECVREALRRQLPEALWPEVPSPSRGAADRAAAAARCTELMKF